MMKHDIDEWYDDRQAAERAAEDLTKWFGYECKIVQEPDGRWKLTAHTDQNLMG